MRTTLFNPQWINICAALCSWICPMAIKLMNIWKCWSPYQSITLVINGMECTQGQCQMQIVSYHQDYTHIEVHLNSSLKGSGHTKICLLFYQVCYDVSHHNITKTKWLYIHMDILYLKYFGIYVCSQMWVQLTIYSLVMEWDGMCLGHEMTWCRSPVAG